MDNNNQPMEDIEAVYFVTDAIINNQAGIFYTTTYGAMPEQGYFVENGVVHNATYDTWTSIYTMGLPTHSVLETGDGWCRLIAN